eukprot:gnl/TRDRNA2_/TRDRNA2_205717_c0_seq1.p1 gnl/TRDRNA2_/TRDRNA2_205717_c0~~gnl/TRDRNA2_/TRDRNA2_205717_c0_seq1.p1  ORF type:complete len:146 (-),score=3.21 gnl/TRDRNA2_/TRDRNA2_205717_c0_seq1:247-684(-)
MLIEVLVIAMPSETALGRVESGRFYKDIFVRNPSSSSLDRYAAKLLNCKRVSNICWPGNSGPYKPSKRRVHFASIFSSSDLVPSRRRVMVMSCGLHFMPFILEFAKGSNVSWNWPALTIQSRMFSLLSDRLNSLAKFCEHHKISY